MDPISLLALAAGLLFGSTQTGEDKPTESYEAIAARLWVLWDGQTYLHTDPRIIPWPQSGGLPQLPAGWVWLPARAHRLHWQGPLSPQVYDRWEVLEHRPVRTYSYEGPAGPKALNTRDLIHPTDISPKEGFLHIVLNTSDQRYIKVRAPGYSKEVLSLWATDVLLKSAERTGRDLEFIRWLHGALQRGMTPDDFDSARRYVNKKGPTPFLLELQYSLMVGITTDAEVEALIGRVWALREATAETFAPHNSLPYMAHYDAFLEEDARLLEGRLLRAELRELGGQ